MDIRIRSNEGDAPSTALQWDTVWDPGNGFGDWALADPSETGNRGGLRAKQGLATAVILCLFTDRRCPDDHPLRRYAEKDPRGWWGDSVDVQEDQGETALCSLLWLLERATATPENARWAQTFAIDALATLKTQGAVARIDVQVALHATGNRIDLLVALYAQDGETLFNRTFELLWRQVGQ